jgi:DHA1 family multidrug resistance protein-like MFS transporter
MKQRIFLIINLSAVSALVILGFAIISPVLPQYALSFSVSVAMTGWAVSSFALARLFMDVPAGILADRFGRKQNMILGLVLIVASSLVSGMASTYSWLIIGRVVQGLGSALYITSATAWVAEISAGEYRGRLMSLYSSLVFIGTSFGPVIGGYTAAHLGLSAPFFVYGGLAALGLLATVPLKEMTLSTPASSRLPFNDVRAVLSSGSFLLVNSAVLALFFLRAGIRSTLVPLYASLNLGLSEERIGLLLTLAAVVTSLVTFPSGWLSDKIGRKIPIMCCLFLSALAIILIPFQTKMSTLLIVMAFYGLSTGLQGSIAAWPADVAPRDKLGTAMGLYRVIGDIGFVVGPITVTYVADNAGNVAIPTLPFVIPAVIASLVGIALIWARDPARKKKAVIMSDHTVDT